MKKILIIAALLGTAIVIGSCKKNISLTPPNGVAVTDYFVNQKDMTAGLAGIYSAFQEEMTGAGQNADEGYGGRYHYWGEARSDNFTSSTFSTNSTVEMALNGLSFTNAGADWGGLYRVVSRANLAIKYFPQVASHDPNVTQVITNNAMAQAYAMRAMAYFYIIRVWKDAPIWTEPYLDVNQPAAREKSSGNKIMDSLIIPDLKRAYDLIQKQQTPVVWNIGEGAICAILGDVYMWRAGMTGLGSSTDYTNALTWYNTLLKTKGPTGAVYQAGTVADKLETTANWKNLFLTPASETEDIWSIYWDYNANGCACIPVSIQLSNNPLTLDPNFQANFKKGYKTDTRVAKTIDTLAGLNHQNLIYKFLPLNPTATGITPVATNANYNVYLTMNRLGDVYLSMAEAYAMTNDLVNALKYYNFIYVRARSITATVPGVAAGVYPTSATMEDAILAERQLELLGEGKRWFDLVRTNRVHQIMDPILNVRNGTRVTNPDGSVTVTPLTTGFAGAPDRYYWPISQNALNNNKKLTQNAGY